MEKGIKAVIFDVGGVLALQKNPKIVKQRGNKTFGVHKYIAKKLGISIDQWFDSVDTIYALSIEGKISKRKALNALSENVKINEKKMEKILSNAYKKNFTTNKELYKIAFKLKKQGYKLALLSDQWHFSKDILMPKRHIKQFNVSIASCNVGMRKPNPKIYKLALKKLKTPARQTLFIDNQIWNIKPAKKLGINTILFKDNKQLIKDLRKFGVEV
ncbi:MAG TPA: HAD family phosphatase [Candidatus Pacearchaeota archaeon]|nr:glucose-1-phosphatase [archaeon BMS3Abin17]HDK41954.1 HAD family phosphatase [Candidatus Pacearchaeota archaeon]HDZ60563.1 HAD family phosphatase [Candidatus Pacearchaeota archaeon]